MIFFILMGWLGRVCVFVGLLGCGVCLVSGEVEGDFLVQSWDVENGLPNDVVRALVQDREGRMWVGTDGGLACFNGRKFEVFTPKTDSVLKDGVVVSLGCTRDGVLWIGTKEGHVYKRVRGVFERVDVSEFGGAAVLNFEEDQGGNLYVSLRSGEVARCRDGKWEVLSRRKGWPEKPLEVHVGENDVVWITGKLNCYRFRNEKLTPYMEKSNYKDFRFYSPGKNGGYWILGNEYLGLYDSHQSQLSLNIRLKLNGDLNQALEDRAQYLWLATTRDGLMRYDRFGKKIHLTGADGLPSNEVLRLYQDADGNLWGGTTKGLILVKRRSFDALDLSKLLKGDEIRVLKQDREGGVWVAGGSGVWKLFGDGLVEQMEFRGKKIVAMEDVGGEMWFVDQAGDCFLKKRGSEDLLLMVDFVNQERKVVSSVFLDQKKRVWIGQEQTKVLWRKRLNGGWEKFDFPAEFGLVDVVGLQESAREVLWVATRKAGVFFLQNGKLTHVFGGRFFPGIQTFFMDEQGCLWVGTRGGGLYRWKNNRLLVMRDSDGLPGDVVGQFFDDGMGYFWVGTNRGMFRILKEQLRMLYEGGNEWGRSFVFYGMEDGVPGLKCLSGSQLSGFSTLNSEVVFPMEHTIVTVGQKKLAEVIAPPKVFLKRMIANDRIVWSASEEKRVLELPFDTKKIQVEYEGVSYQTSGGLRYRLQLIGRKRKVWEYTDLEKKDFYGLEPGEYRCSIEVANREGNWSLDAEEILIVIRPPYWQTKNFILFVTVVAVGGLGYLLFLRIRKMYRRRLLVLSLQNRVELERARIARDIHDGLGAKVAQIRMILAKVARGECLDVQQRRAFQFLDELSVELIESLDETVWVVTPNNDRLRQVVNYMVFYAESVCKRVDWGCEFVYEGEFGNEEVATELRHELFLMYKESITNALKYSGSKRLRIEFTRREGRFGVCVCDFGCGFEVDGETSRNGLRNLRVRAEKIGCVLGIESSVGVGTRIYFRISL